MIKFLRVVGYYYKRSVFVISELSQWPFQPYLVSSYISSCFKQSGVCYFETNQRQDIIDFDNRLRAFFKFPGVRKCERFIKFYCNRILSAYTGVRVKIAERHSTHFVVSRRPRQMDSRNNHRGNLNRIARLVFECELIGQKRRVNRLRRLDHYFWPEVAIAD